MYTKDFNQLGCNTTFPFGEFNFAESSLSNEPMVQFPYGMSALDELDKRFGVFDEPKKHKKGKKHKKDKKHKKGKKERKHKKHKLSKACKKCMSGKKHKLIDACRMCPNNHRHPILDFVLEYAPKAFDVAHYIVGEISTAKKNPSKNAKALPYHKDYVDLSDSDYREK